MRAYGLPLFGAVLCAVLFVSFAEAQSVPPLDKIQNQAELDRAGAALDAALFDSYTNAIWTGSRRFSLTTRSSITIKAASLWVKPL
jgi:hypothetical protein